VEGIVGVAARSLHYFFISFRLLAQDFIEPLCLCFTLQENSIGFPFCLYSDFLCFGLCLNDRSLFLDFSRYNDVGILRGAFSFRTRGFCFLLCLIRFFQGARFLNILSCRRQAKGLCFPFTPFRIGLGNGNPRFVLPADGE